MVVPSESITADEFLLKLAERGIDPINNSVMASRMPPGKTTPMHPESFFEVYDEGDLFQKFGLQLGSPQANIAPNFNTFASVGSRGVLDDVPSIIADLNSKPKAG